MTSPKGTARARLLRLFVVSYAPLAAIGAVQLSDAAIERSARGTVFAVALLWTIWGALDAIRLPRGALKKSAISAKFHDVQDQGGAVAAYLATYLLPFVGFDVAGWRDAVALVVYFGVLVVVFLRSNLALVNPALYVAGWRVLAATRTMEHLEERRVHILVPADSEFLSAKDYQVVTFGDFLVLKSGSRKQRSG